MIEPVYVYLTDEGNQPWLSEKPTKAELRAHPNSMLIGVFVVK